MEDVDKSTKHRILGDLSNIEISLDNIKSSPQDSVYYHAEEIRKSINKIKELLKSND